MTCSKPAIAERLPDLVSGRVHGEEAEEIREHLLSCDSCSEEYSVLGQLAAVEVPEPEAGFFDEMPGRVIRSIREEKASSGPRFSLPAFDIKWKAGLAAASLAAAALLIFLLPGPGPVLVKKTDDNIPPISVAMGFETNILTEGDYKASDVTDALEFEVVVTEDELAGITGQALIGGIEYMDLDEEALLLFEEELGSIPQKS